MKSEVNSVTRFSTRRRRRRHYIPRSVNQDKSKSSLLSAHNTGIAVRTQCSPVELVVSEVTCIQSLLRQERPMVVQEPITFEGKLGKDVGLRMEGFPLPLTPRLSQDRRDDMLWTHFNVLRTKLIEQHHALETLDAPEILSPFLTAVRSANTSVNIRNAALKSLEKFFAVQVIHLGMSGVPEAMRAFTASIAKCRNMASESSTDITILLHTLLAMQAVIYSPCMRVMDDVSVCEMMEVGLSLCCQMRLDDNLRRLAENCMISMVRVVFETLKTIHTHALSETTVNSALRVQVHPSFKDKTQSISDISLLERPESPDQTPSTNQTAMTSGAASTAESMAEKAVNEASMSTESTTLNNEAAKENTASSPSSPSLSSRTTRPYGIPSMHELLRVLVSLCDPHDLHYTDTMRQSALSILLAAIEVGGHSISKFSTLRTLIADQLLCYAFQLLNTEKLRLLSVTLQIIIATFDTMRPYLTLQLELFVDLVLKRLSLSDAELLSRATRSFPISEYRQLLLDTLIRVTQLEEMLPTLWLNYDCAIGRRNLVDMIISHLCMGHNGMVGRQCQQVLISLLELMETRSTAQHNDTEDTSHLLSAEKLRERKDHKRLLYEAACRFNNSPREGVVFLEEHQIIPKKGSPEREKALAQFFHTSTDIQKAILGEFLGKEANQPVLDAFIRHLNFAGKRIDEAIRLMLEKFRLPGEAQQIDRIVETFSRIYFASSQTNIASQEASYVLAFSVIMLNTDLHSPNVKKRMTLEDYMRNLRGVNSGEDFDVEYLTTIYNSIRDNEIIMPEEHEGQLGFMYAWREMIRASKELPKMTYCFSSIYDRDLFITFSRSILTMFGGVLEQASNDTTLDTALCGIRLCAELAAHFNVVDILDTVVSMLAGFTHLANRGIDVGVRRYGPHPNKPDQTVPTTPLSVRLGRDYKAEIILIALFDIVHHYGDRLRDGWITVVDVITTAFRAAMLPDDLTTYVDVVSGTTQIPFKVNDPVSAGSRDSSIFSALSNYLMPTYDPETEPALEEDISAALNTQQCLEFCHLHDILSGRCYSDEQSLQQLIIALLTVQVPPPPRSPPVSSGRDSVPRPVYNPVDVFTLEVAVRIAIAHSSQLPKFWTYFSKRISAILEDSEKQHQFLVKRAVTHLFILCKAIPLHDVELFSNALATLRTVLRLPATIFEQIVDITTMSISQLVQARLDTIITAECQQVVLVELATRCASYPNVYTSISEMVDYVIKYTKYSEHGFRFAAELLASLGLGCAEQAAAPSDKPGSKIKRNRTAAATQALQAAKQSAIERAQQVVERMGNMSTLAEEMMTNTTLAPREAWLTLWYPILNGLARMCVHPTRDVRYSAMNILQRLLFSPSLTNLNGDAHLLCMDRVLLPMHARLSARATTEEQKSIASQTHQMPALDNAELIEIRSRTFTLLGSFFLHHLPNLLHTHELLPRWSRILDIAEEYLDPSLPEHATEAVREQLKNLLLVIHASDGFGKDPNAYTVQTSTETNIDRTSDSSTLEGETGDEAQTHRSLEKRQYQLWHCTWSRLDVLCPGLRAELFPPPPPPQPVTTSVESVTTEDTVTTTATTITTNVSDVDVNNSSETVTTVVTTDETVTVQETTTVEIVTVQETVTETVQTTTTNVAVSDKPETTHSSPAPSPPKSKKD